MFWIGVPLALSAALMMRVMLPHTPARETIRYPDALASLFRIWREEPKLRRATLTQAALFASFTVFWTILSLRLLEPRFGLGSEVAGIFGVIGATGMFAAPMAGRFVDKHGPRPVVSLSAVGTLASWIVFGLWGSLAGLVVGVVILDIGVNAALVSNQHQIFALRPEARSRLNTVFMTGMFVGASLGSLGATAAYHMAGWPAVSVYGGVLGMIAILLQLPLPALRASPAGDL
jgi:predicted MFS family arabinose efflux permease